MVHLMVHLVEEAKLGGPVHYRWMYPFERYFVRLKSYVRNRAYPEGSIAEGYIADECLTFCLRYFEGVQTRFNRPPRIPNIPLSIQEMYLFASAGEPIGKVEVMVLDEKSWIQMHRYVLRHCDDIQQFRNEFITLEKRQRRRHARLSSDDIDKLVNEKFHDWFKTKVMQPDFVTSNSSKLVTLGKGPNERARKFSGLSINGFKFRTMSREIRMVTQNSGVVNISEEGGVNYYGKINDIIEINYSDLFRVVLFKCDWVDVHRSSGIKRDEYGFTFVNFNHLIHTGENLEDDPYVFSSQVEQVFYVKDPVNVNLSMVVKTKPRDLFDMGKNITIDDGPRLMSPSSQFDQCEPAWVRTDIEADEIV